MLVNNENLKIAVTAAIYAGEAIMSVYNSDFKVEHKDDLSPLTDADKKANDIINSYLAPTGIPIISEENKQIDFSERRQWNQCWIVDPLDGTKEFVKRNGEFTVNISLVEKGSPKLGVIFVPVNKTLYYADVNEGYSRKIELKSFDANIEDFDRNSKTLLPRTDRSKTIVVGSRSHMNEQTSVYISDIKKQGRPVDVVSKGSSLKFCLVAEGEADVYPRFAPTMEWDTAAGQAICNAVGVQVISQKTNEHLLYNKEHLLNPYFLVTQ